MVVNVEVPPFVDVRVIGDLLGAPAICFQLDLVLREIEEGEVGFGLPPPVQGVLPGWVTFWRRVMVGGPACRPKMYVLVAFGIRCPLAKCGRYLIRFSIRLSTHILLKFVDASPHALA